ncbi:MAG: FecR domain-containing protein [Pseudomonadota bacterium]
MPKDLPIKDMTIQITEGEPVTIPSADLLMDATFIKDGPDLILKGEDGVTVTVEGYFNTLDAPDLVSGGVRVSPDMVESFAKSVHAGEYADALNSMNDASAIGQVTEIVGQVIITRADGTEVIAESGTVIQQGDVIETSGDGAANIMFADNTNFAISEDARLSVDEFVYDNDAQDGSSFFSMLKGAFVYTSGMIGKDDPGNVNIETPAGSIGIRGTVVMGKIDPLGENSEITIIDGAVLITNASGTVELNDSLETVRLTNYETAPEMMGQINADDAQSSYQSLTGVSGSTFEQAFGPDSNNNTNTQTTQQQGENEGEAELSPDAEQEGDSSENTEPSDQDDAESLEADSPEDTEESGQLETETETVETPTNINDTTTTTSSDSDTTTTSSTTTTSTTSDTSTRTTSEDTNSIDDTVTDSSFTLKDLAAFDVREFEDTGVKIGNVTTDSTDTDIKYSIINGTQFYNGKISDTPANDLEAFTIDQNTGEIFVNNTFAFNANYQTEFTLDIQAENSAGESAVKSYTVQLNPLLPEAVSRIVGSDADDTGLYATAEDQELMYGGKGNDTLIDGGDGDDLLIGGAGDDLLYIQNTLGNETVLGGAGNDTLQVHSIMQDDVMNGGSGFDTLKLTNSGADTFDFRGTMSSNMDSIESISLDNASGGTMKIEIDDAAINQLAGPDAPLIIRAKNSFDTHIYLEGDWEHLTNYDGSGNINAAYRNTDTGELVVTDSTAAAVNVIETSSGSAVDNHGSMAGPGDIGALDDLASETLPPLM